jgi:lambda repressor-like predicted transcriptional regulator
MLPSGWSSYNPQQKINWFNANQVSIAEMGAAGVSNDDINWMLQNGYKPADAKAGPTQAEQDLIDLYRSVLGREPDAEGLEYWKSVVGPTLEESERTWWMGGAQEELARAENKKPEEKEPEDVDTSKVDLSKLNSAPVFRDYIVQKYGRVNESNIQDVIKDAQQAGISNNTLSNILGASVPADKTVDSVSYIPNFALSERQQTEDAIAQLYKDELGRDPDAEGLNYYVEQFMGGRNIADIKAEIDFSEEGSKFDTDLNKTISDKYGAITGDNLNTIISDLQKQGYSFDQVADAIGGTITKNEKGESILSYAPPAAAPKTFTNDEVQKLITDQFGSVTPENFQQVVNAVVGAGVPVDQFATIVGATIGTNDAGDTTLSLPAAVQETKPLSLVDQIKAQQQVTGITHQASFSQDQNAIINDMAEKLGKYGVQSLEDLKPITDEVEYQLEERPESPGTFNLMRMGVGADGEMQLQYAGRTATPDEINQLQTKGTITENVGVLNARTGEEIPVNELNNAKGSGFTYYKIEFSPDGVAVPYGYKEATGAGALGDQIKSIASLPPIAAALAAVTAGTLNIQGPGMFELGLSKPAAAALGAFTSTSIATGDLSKAAQAAILAGGSTYALQEAGLIKPGVTKPIEELTLSDFEGSGTGFGDTTDISAADIRNILNQSGTTVSSLSQANPITAAAADITVPIFGQGAQLAGVVPAGGITALQLGSGLTPKVEVTSARDTGSTAGTTAGLTGGYQPIETSPYTVNVTGTKLDASTPAAGGTVIAAKPSTTQLVSDLATGKKSVTDLTSDEVETLIKAGLLVTTLVGSAVDTGDTTIPTTTVDTEAINTIRPGVTVDLNPTIPGATTTTLTPGQQTYNLLGINAGTPTTQPTVPTTGIGSLPVPTYKPPPFLGPQAPGASRVTPPVLTADPTLTQKDFDFAAAEIARQQAALPPITQTVPTNPFEAGLAKATTVAKRAGGIVALRGGGMPLAFMGGGMTGPVNQPRMLSGGGDGMSDSIPATIDGTQPARLADGEFVIPADVVADIGNGSSKAGATQLYAMMDRVRQARHGTTKQPPEVNMNKVLPV